MANLKKCLRTCIICREKLEQKELLRLCCTNKKIEFYNNVGRSFYLCYPCTKTLKDEMKTKKYKKIEKILNKECRDKKDYFTQLKEILVDVR